MAPLTELSTFTGVGGGLLATKHFLGWRTVCYVEWDKYAVKVLKARIADGLLDDAPIWDNAFTFDGRPWAGLVDVVTAGFPCQPFSTGGFMLGEDDPRNGWPALKRILGEVRPRYAFLENVPGLLSFPYFGTILGDLASLGYDARWEIVSACSVGAPHTRERLFILADSCGFRATGGASAEMAKRAMRRERRKSGAKIGLRIRDLAKLKYGVSMKPILYEWLMGWVPRWTALEPLEMGRFQQWLEKHGVDYQENDEAKLDKTLH